MTSRIGSPDTQADLDLRACLDQYPTRSFIMVAGAGSGKTTSLVKALSHLEMTKGKALKRRGQKIACVTYTEVAVGEIRTDVGDSNIFHVSTIHSFLWTLVHSFQSDLREWVAERINEKIAEAEEKIAKPKTQAKTKLKAAEDIARYKEQLEKLAVVQKFSYGTGSKYEDGLLGHDDVLKVAPILIGRHELLRTIIAKRFPFIFVDESQDTNPTVVAALREIASMPHSGLCLGFFGDPMQKIYQTGAGVIEPGEGWNQITKPENFRCPGTVLSVINNIRAEDDRIVQVAGNRIGPDGLIAIEAGTAKLFIVPSGGSNRSDRLNQVRAWMANANDDPLWQSDDRSHDVRLLVLVHRIAAKRLGFPDIYAAMNDNKAPGFKEGIQEGTVWVLRPFLTYLMPLVVAAKEQNDFEVIETLRKNCPLLSAERLPGQNVAELLARLKRDIEKLEEILKDDSTKAIFDVLKFVQEQELAAFDERFLPYLSSTANEEDVEYKAVTAFLAAPVAQMWGYRRYIADESPFWTQQGIKGAQFQRVLTVLDDAESDYNLFSYGKYWGIEDLSETDAQHIGT